ncbi:hypothetical protein, partial [Burkholderia sp. 28_3]|uniref:hypothetical protein n=1 Tax=Burkholderia sp. 28_3 TaxID=2183921 RepID=UPI001C65F5B4
MSVHNAQIENFLPGSGHGVFLCSQAHRSRRVSNTRGRPARRIVDARPVVMPPRNQVRRDADRSCCDDVANFVGYLIPPGRAFAVAGPRVDCLTVDRLRETLINGPTSEVAGEMASNFLDDEANRRSI